MNDKEKNILLKDEEKRIEETINRYYSAGSICY
jgi:hypothetical protein